METQVEISQIVTNLQIQAPAGFAIACHMQYTTPRYLFQTYAKDWIAHYSQMGFVMQDPIVAWCFTNTGATRWSSLVGQDSAGVLSAAAKYDMNFGVAIGIDQGDSRTLAGFSRADREFTDAEIVEISGFATRLHDLTAKAETLDPVTRAALHKLSIDFTHP